MKLAIISDIHLGDKNCTLVESSGKSYKAGPMYKDFGETAGTGNDYLILLGDILDFSVTSYENAYKAAKTFFSLIKNDNITKQIIYVAGNHDYDIWGVVEYEANIIYQIKNGRLPRKFRMAVPGILDDRPDSANYGFSLPGIEKRTDGNYSYGGLFLDYITRENSNELNGDDSHFIFAYPNVYLATGDKCILMTHGQYLEPYWSLLSEWAPRIFKNDLPVGKEIDITELVGINFPFNQLACSGVGQAGVLSDVISRLQSQIKKGEIEKAKEYLNNLDDYIDDKVFDYKRWYQFISEMTSDLISNKVKDMLIELISSQKETRYNENFFDKPDVKKRFCNYYNATLAEIKYLVERHNISVPLPDTVITGHTHDPVSWHSEKATEIVTASGLPVRIYNTGGWLWKETGNKKVFSGAEVFKYESGKGLSSISVTG